MKLVMLLDEVGHVTGSYLSCKSCCCIDPGPLAGCASDYIDADQIAGQ